MSRRERVMAWTRDSVRGLKPYYKAPIEGDPLRLDQNTNLYGPNPALAGLDPASLDVTLYPSRDSDALLADLAATHGVSPDNLLVGNGSDEILDLITKAFTQTGQAVAVPAPSYSLYPFYARLQGLRLLQVPLRGGFRLDVDGLLAKQAELTMVASPNNPTGNASSTEGLERLIAGSPGIVIIDEAYIEYAGEERSLLPRVEDHDNLIVMRTFSKAYGLAGLRIGYCAANTDLMERLRLVKPPFNLNLLSETAARHALAAQDWMRGVVEATVHERENLAEVLRAHGLKVFPSDANFLLCQTPDDAALLATGLRERGILARTFPGIPGMEQCIRFTVGRPEHTDALADALRDMEGAE